MCSIFSKLRHFEQWFSVSIIFALYYIFVPFKVFVFYHMCNPMQLRHSLNRAISAFSCGSLMCPQGTKHFGER